MKLKILLTIAVFTFLVILVSYKTRPGVIVDIKNEMKIPAKNVELKYSGGKFVIDILNPGTSREFRVKPVSESDLALSYMNIEGKTVIFNVEVYLEPRYSGEIEIMLKQNDKFGRKVNIITNWFGYIFSFKFM